MHGSNVMGPAANAHHVVPDRYGMRPESASVNRRIGRPEHIVDENVEAPLLCRHARNECCDRSIVLMIHPDRYAPATERIDFSCGGLDRQQIGRRCSRGRAARDVYRAAGFAKALRNAAPDAATRAGDDRDLAFQIGHTASRDA